MLFYTYIIDILLLFFIPIALGIYLVKKRDLEGRWWWIAAFIYIVSQVLILPLQNYLINPYLNGLSYSGGYPSISVLIFGGILLGLSVGLIEELLRFSMFRWWTKDARTFESGVLLGAGHAGAGSIILGLLVLYNFVNMAYVRNVDLTSYFSADQFQYVQAQVSAFWSAPWYYALREALGQVFMLIVNVSLAIMVLQVFIRKQWHWVLLAIFFHTLVEATRVITLNLTNDFTSNLILGVYAIVGAFIVMAIYRTQKKQNKTTVIGQTD